MLNLNKKQVGALLKVMGKDSTRPVLESIRIVKHETQYYAIATDGYMAAILALDNEDAEVMNNKLIRREAIEKWYKLATGKSRLTTLELQQVLMDDYAQHGGYMSGDYPLVLSVLPEQGKTTPTETIVFNAEYIKAISDLAGKPLKFELHGSLGAITAYDEQNTYVIMPIRG